MRVGGRASPDRSARFDRRYAIRFRRALGCGSLPNLFNTPPERWQLIGRAFETETPTAHGEEICVGNGHGVRSDDRSRASISIWLSKKAYVTSLGRAANGRATFVSVGKVQGSPQRLEARMKGTHEIGLVAQVHNSRSGNGC